MAIKFITNKANDLFAVNLMATRHTHGIIYYKQQHGNICMTKLSLFRLIFA